MEPALGIKIAALALLVLLSALTWAGLASVHQLNRARLRSLVDAGNSRAKAVLALTAEPISTAGSLASLQLITVAAVVAITLSVAVDLSAASAVAGMLFCLAVLAVLLILQILARGVAMAGPEGAALWLYRPLWLAGMLLWPLMAALRGLEHRMLQLMNIDRRLDLYNTEDELRMLVEAAQDSHGLEQEEREMIHGVFELSQVTAREVMVPRIDIAAVPIEACVRDALDLVVQTGHSRLPVYEGTIDQIVGVLHAKDLLEHLAAGSASDPIRPLATLRQVYFVPEAKKIDEVLQQMQRDRVHMAVVLDEYGGTAGLVTIEDLLEEIVGEIRDEYDAGEEASVVQISPHEIVADARTSIRDVNDLLALSLPDDEFDTVGGLVYDRLGKVPTVRDSVEVDGCTISVEATEGRRLRKVRILVGERSELTPS